MEHLLEVSMMNQERGDPHGDPFDRLIIAQGLVLSIPIVSRDPKFKDFGVEVIW